MISSKEEAKNRILSDKNWNGESDFDVDLQFDKETERYYFLNAFYKATFGHNRQIFVHLCVNKETGQVSNCTVDDD